MNICAALVLSCALAAAPAAWANMPDAACDPAQAFSLSIEETGYRVDNNLPSNVLARKSSQAVGGTLMLGLTAVQSSIEVNFDEAPPPGPQAAEARPVGKCAPKLEVVLRYAPIRVFIAKEFWPNSCPYKVILAHEMRHVTAYRQHLTKVESIVRQALAQRFSDAAGAHDDNALQHEVDHKWIPYIRAELSKIDAPQRLIDSEEESGQLSSACHGEMGIILGTRY